MTRGPRELPVNRITVKRSDLEAVVLPRLLGNVFHVTSAPAFIGRRETWWRSPGERPQEARMRVRCGRVEDVLRIGGGEQDSTSAWTAASAPQALSR